MPLSITTVKALTGIDRTPSKLELQTQNAVLLLKRNEAKVSIHTEKPRVEIDQYEARASAGMKNLRDLTMEIVQRAYQQVLETIGKTAGDGDTLAAIENGGNPIADIAVRDAWPEHEFGLDTIPKVGPRISVTGSSEIEWNVDQTVNAVEGNYTPGRVNINFYPAVIKIYMKQYPSVNIEYANSRVDMAL